MSGWVFCSCSIIFLEQFGINKHLYIFSETTNCTHPMGKNLLVLFYSKLHSNSYDYLYKMNLEKFYLSYFFLSLISCLCICNEERTDQTSKKLIYPEFQNFTITVYKRNWKTSVHVTNAPLNP